MFYFARGILLHEHIVHVGKMEGKVIVVNKAIHSKIITFSLQK
jgi:hypothetical protein